MIVTVGNPTAGHSHAPLEIWLVVAGVLGPTVGLCLLGARIWPGRRAAVLLAVVSGSSWGVSAVLTKGVVSRLGDGIGALLLSPELYAWVAVGLFGTVSQQSSFRAGMLTASLPTMTVTEPMVASVLGIAVLGEVLRPGHAGWFTLVLAVVVMVVATAALARDEAATVQTPDDNSRRVTPAEY